MPVAGDMVRVGGPMLLGRDRIRRLGSSLRRADWPITVIFVCALIGLWQLAGSWVGHDVYWFKTPVQIFDAFRTSSSDLWSASRATFGRVMLGFGIGAALGVVLGLVAGISRVIEDLIDPVVGLTYSIPKIALFPALLLLMGYSDRSRVTVVALVAFYPAYINAHAGTRGIDPQLLKIAANLEAGKLRSFTAVIFPAALPRIVVGLRISLAISYTILFVAEASGGTGKGLGMMIQVLVSGNDFATTYAAMFCYAVLGFVSDRIVVGCGRVLTRGQVLERVGTA